MDCRNPEHATAGQACAGCTRDCEAENTRLRDQLQRMMNDQGAFERRTEAAAARTAHGHMVTWAGRYYLQPAIRDLLVPLEEALGRGTMVDPAWGRTKDQRRKLETLKWRCEQAQAKYWEVASAAEPAWQADPREQEIERLRKVMTEHGQALHRQHGTPFNGFDACGCPGCELIRAVDAGTLNLAGPLELPETAGLSCPGPSGKQRKGPAMADEFQGVTGWKSLEDTSDHRLEMDADPEGFVLLHDTTDPTRVIRTTLTSLERFARPVAAGTIPQEIRQRTRTRQSQR